MDLAGAAHLTLASSVAYLDPATAVFDAMLEGWQRQQRTRFLRASTIEGRVLMVRRFHRYTNQYPWEWEPAEVEAFFDHLRSAGPRPITVSTARSYQTTLRMFCDFVTDARYGWAGECLQRFGRAPAQILHEWNSIVHVTEFDGQPGRRPLTYDEVQALFDAADGRVEQIRTHQRKGVLAALRDAALLKTVYAFGLRRAEACGLDESDFRHNPKAKRMGQFGGVFVRWGKSSRGSPPKRRTVLTVPEMDWIVPVLDQYSNEVRPRIVGEAHPALWVTERGGRMSLRRLNFAFAEVRDLAGLPPELDLHCLRHSYVTHLIEFDYPEKFVQDQVGHAYASTTAIYSGVSDEYRTRLINRKLEQHKDDLWGGERA
ncbi:tyrosine-type recombinase/integrase [Micromonospora sediminicola]|uniref:tyrosine-type recombinase/integrase n=1 Tax=Micromonospora sediminicola TaxID=946078 RepID=UPI0033B065E0